MSNSGSLVSRVTEAPAASGCAIRGGALVDSCAGLLLLDDEDCACAVAIRAKPMPTTAAARSSLNHEAYSKERDDDEEKAGVINKGTINSTLPKEFRGAIAWLQPLRRSRSRQLAQVARLAADRDTGKGKYDSASHRRAKDAGRLKDAHYELVDYLAFYRCVHWAGDDVVVINAPLLINIGFNDNGSFVAGGNGVRTDHRIEIVRHCNRAQRFVVGHDRLGRSHHTEQKH